MHRAQLEREKAFFEMQLAKQKHEFEMQLELLRHQLEENKLQQEMALKYHTVASTEKIENSKVGDTPERRDAFNGIVTELRDAIKRKRGGLPPPGGSVPPATPA